MKNYRPDDDRTSEEKERGEEAHGRMDNNLFLGFTLRERLDSRDVQDRELFRKIAQSKWEIACLPDIEAVAIDPPKLRVRHIVHGTVGKMHSEWPERFARQIFTNFARGDHPLFIFQWVVRCESKE
jgi:hypothetical protein